MSSAPPARLLAIVSVPESDRVRCGQPGCGHPVYRAIHVVQDGGQLLVLGSTCFGRRYGAALGDARYGGGGSGRMLSEEEWSLLMSNTAALLAKFEAEAEEARQKLAGVAAAMRQRFQGQSPAMVPAAPSARPGAAFFPRDWTPWPWASQWTSQG